jgi:hypothetical protein
VVRRKRDQRELRPELGEHLAVVGESLEHGAAASQPDFRIRKRDTRGVCNCDPFDARRGAECLEVDREMRAARLRDDANPDVPRCGRHVSDFSR